MAENLAFKDKLVWFGLDWFSLVWILMLQSVKEVLVNLQKEINDLYVSPPPNANFSTNLGAPPPHKFKK